MMPSRSLARKELNVGNIQIDIDLYNVVVEQNFCKGRKKIEEVREK